MDWICAGLFLLSLWFGIAAHLYRRSLKDSKLETMMAMSTIESLRGTVRERDSSIERLRSAFRETKAANRRLANELFGSEQVDQAMAQYRAEKKN